MTRKIGQEATSYIYLALEHILKNTDSFREYLLTANYDQPPTVFGMGYRDESCSHVWMWELDYKESWVPKNWCFWIVEKTLKSPLDYKEIQPVHPKGNQSWIFIGRSDDEAEAPILWSPDVKNWLIWKNPDAGQDWRQEKGTTEHEMIGWHHQLNGHEFE